MSELGDCNPFPEDVVCNQINILDDLDDTFCFGTTLKIQLFIPCGNGQKDFLMMGKRMVYAMSCLRVVTKIRTRRTLSAKAK